jgi:hypothetical protein
MKSGPIQKPLGNLQYQSRVSPPSARSHATGRLAVLARLVASVSPPARQLGKQVSTPRCFIFERYIHFCDYSPAYNLLATPLWLACRIYALSSTHQAMSTRRSSARQEILYAHRTHEAITVTKGIAADARPVLEPSGECTRLRRHQVPASTSLAVVAGSRRAAVREQRTRYLYPPRRREVLRRVHAECTRLCMLRRAVDKDA